MKITAITRARIWWHLRKANRHMRSARRRMRMGDISGSYWETDRADQHDNAARKLRLLLGCLLACVYLQGCAFCQRHETTCNAAFIAGSALIVGGLMVRDQRRPTGCICGCPGTPTCR